MGKPLPHPITTLKSSSRTNTWRW